MYWNLFWEYPRCAEKSWTDTFDVLKLFKLMMRKQNSGLEPTHSMYWNLLVRFFLEVPLLTLNRHIRCIETRLFAYLRSSEFTWTDTFDVLKPRSIFTGTNLKYPWTDTFDVLKQKQTVWWMWQSSLEPTHSMYWNVVKFIIVKVIINLNRHIRCIET